MGNKESSEIKKKIKEIERTRKYEGKGEGREEIPAYLFTIPSLTELWLQDNNLKHLPPSLTALTSLQLLYLPNNLLSSFPSEVISTLNSLEEVNLSGNVNLSELPSSLGLHCPNLKQLYLNELAQLKEIPESIGLCSSLRVLHINNSSLSSLPSSVSSLHRLSMLALNHNSLQVPSSLPPLFIIIYL